MKQFDDVFPKEYKSPSYPTQRISQLEDLFKIESEQPEKRFFHLCLIMDGLRLRFYNADEFYKGKGHKTYQRLLERKIDLKRQKPASGMAPIREWEKETQEIATRIANLEEHKKKILDQIQAELDVDEAFELPKSLAEYLGLKRLKYHDGSVVPKRKALELQKIGADMETWPYLYYSLPRHMSMFDQADKLANIPKIVKADALDRGRRIEELVEDDAYVEELAQFLTGNDCEGIKTYIAGHREERDKAREAAKKRPRVERIQEYVLAEYPDRSLMLGSEVLIAPTDFLQILRSEKYRKELTALFKRYVIKGSRSSRQDEGPRRSILELVVDGDRVPDLKCAVAELIENSKAEAEHEAKVEVPNGGAEAALIRSPSHSRKDLFFGEYWGIDPIRDDEGGEGY
jgi:hypothetical protein